MKIIIEVEEKGEAIAELDNRNPKIAKAIYNNLPIYNRALRWLDELFFEIEVTMNDENPSKTAEIGDISYWNPGYAFCIFFGNTQPYSEVNHIGKITENLELFFNCDEGDRIILRKYEE
ncbi:MAG: hypothetical protein LBU74_01130 [Methanobacteriaceae archaeon]|jgi:hypothetical protein|nr:hypothetical protein [Candidatus Methanorudis spinitermitis]